MISFQKSNYKQCKVVLLSIIFAIVSNVKHQEKENTSLHITAAPKKRLNFDTEKWVIFDATSRTASDVYPMWKGLYTYTFSLDVASGQMPSDGTKSIEKFSLHPCFH